MGTLLEKAASPDMVSAAWKRFRNDKTVWERGISKKEMERNVGYHLLKLSEELRTNTYMPNPVRFFPVQKGNGRQRLISAVTLRDKVAQRAVLNVLEPMLEKTFHHDSYGYRSGRSVEMALGKVREFVLCGMDWLVDADIYKCFDEIPHRPMLRSLEKLVPDRELIGLIQRWVDVGTIRRGFISGPCGIPQGSVLSPVLCNVYLTSWDYEMSAKNLPFVRFADDFLVFAASEKEAQKALTATEKALERLYLKLHPEKTRIVKSGPKVRFLGKKLPRKPDNEK
jgi:group II intron reverse transcriptase/maturase